MVVSLLLGLLVHQDRPTVKETLPNGASVFVHNISGSGRVSITLAMTACSETAETHGVRHLVEHLLARSVPIDKPLEAMGAVLVAETTRDAVIFQTTVPKQQLANVMGMFGDLAKPAVFTADALSREREVMRQEAALRAWRVGLVSDAWGRLYGPTALDPFGNPDALAKMTPESLATLERQVQAPRGLSLAIVGDLDSDADKVAARARELLSPILPVDTVPPAEMNVQSASAFVGSAEGEAVSVAVDGFTDKVSLATLAAGFGLRAWIAGAEVFFLPSQRAGLVAVVLDSSNGWAHAGANLSGKEALIAQTGLRLLKAWSSETTNSPSALSRLMAVSLPYRPGFNFEVLTEAANGLSRADVQAKVAQFLKAGKGQ
ncbi:MAG: insulinase family protein [Armatimonadetes bacterium]|nr:insulinase family protein [Armatimonadota bacterium]